MILSKRTRNRISAVANLFDCVAIRLRKFVRDTTPKRGKGDVQTEARESGL